MKIWVFLDEVSDPGFSLEDLQSPATSEEDTKME